MGPDDKQRRGQMWLLYYLTKGISENYQDAITNIRESIDKFGSAHFYNKNEEAFIILDKLLESLDQREEIAIRLRFGVVTKHTPHENPSKDRSINIKRFDERFQICEQFNSYLYRYYNIRKSGHIKEYQLKMIKFVYEHYSPFTLLTHDELIKKFVEGGMDLFFKLYKTTYTHYILSMEKSYELERFTKVC